MNTYIHIIIFIIIIIIIIMISMIIYICVYIFQWLVALAAGSAPHAVTHTRFQHLFDRVALSECVGYVYGAWLLIQSCNAVPLLFIVVCLSDVTCTIG